MKITKIQAHAAPRGGEHGVLVGGSSLGALETRALGLEHVSRCGGSRSSSRSTRGMGALGDVVAYWRRPCAAASTANSAAAAASAHVRRARLIWVKFGWTTGW